MILMILSKSFANPQRLFKIYCQNVHWDCITWDISKAYLGHISGIPRGYLGHSLGISWINLGHILSISLAYLGYILGITWVACQDWLSRLLLRLLSRLLSRL